MEEEEKWDMGRKKESEKTEAKEGGDGRKKDV